MAIAVADSWKGRAASTTVAIATSGIQTGDVLVAVTAFAAGADPGMLVPTDNQSNVWTQRSATTWDATFSQPISICDCKVAATGPTTVTLRSTAADAIGGAVFRVTGHDPTTYNDQFNNKEQLATNPTSPSITCVSGNRLYVTAATWDELNTNVATIGDGYSLTPPAGQSETDNSVTTGFFVATKVAAAGTEAPQWTVAIEAWAMAIGSYREASSGPLPSDTPFPLLGRGASW